MTANVSCAEAEATIWLQLLDPSHSYPTQTWKLKGTSSIRIGRLDDNEVVVPHASVSRVHVMLNWQEGAWHLVNVGRFGTLISGKSVGQVRLEKDATIQLGTAGPTIKLLLSESNRDHHGETCEHPTVTLADINHSLKQRKVAEIADSEFFQQLQKRARQLRGSKADFDPEDTV